MLGSSKSKGVAILFSSCLRVDIEDQCIDQLGQYVFLNVRIDENLYNLATIYGLNAGQISFLEDTSKLFADFATGPIILGSDLNAVADPSIDCSHGRRKDPNRLVPRYRRVDFSPLLWRFHHMNAWCHKHPGERDYSYFLLHFQSHSRIDYILMSDLLFPHL